MKNILKNSVSGLLFAAVCGVGAPIMASEMHHDKASLSPHAHQQHTPSQENSPPNSPVAQLLKTKDATVGLKVTPRSTLKVGEETTLTLKLSINKEGSSVYSLKEDDLKIVHERRVHVLVIDPSLTDYQHLHPKANDDGTYTVSFTPHKGGVYKVFADITPDATGEQTYIPADLSVAGEPAGTPDSQVCLTTQKEGYTFSLSSKEPVTAGQMTELSLKIEKDGKPLETLEPVMGAFAHMVGFPTDRSSVAHLHPLGAEPKTNSQRGTSPLKFHAMPQTSGFLKLFAQIKINGKEIFVPFGLNVTP